MFESFFEVKEPSALEIGELIVVGYGSEQSFAIVYHVNQSRVSHIVLQPYRNNPAFIAIADYRLSDTTTFGTEWIIEPIQHSNIAVNAQPVNQHTPGLIRVSTGGAKLQYLNPQDGIGQIDLSSYEIVSTQYDSTVQVVAWKLWASDSHRTEEGAVPLMTFDAAAEG